MVTQEIQVKRGLSHHVELTFYEPLVTLTLGVPCIPGFPPLQSFNKCALGTEEARVRESTGPSPQGAYRLWENSVYAGINHQAE